MSLTAGFDLVLEISNALLLKLLKSNLKIQGVAANPPFEITVSITTSGVTASGHVIVDDLQLDLNADDTVTVTLLFSNSSIIAETPLPLTVSALDGNLAIQAPIKLGESGTPNKKVPVVDLGAATVTVNFTQAAQNKISSALAGTLITLPVFMNLVTQAFTDFVHDLGVQMAPLGSKEGFNVVPGVDGAISPSLQFEKLEVHCIPHADRNKQAVGLFGIVLAANHSKGNHIQKTATAITAGHDVCISISPETFQSKILCPIIAKELIPKEFEKDPLAAVSKLPPSCGSSSGVEKDGVKITGISSSFAQGHIDLNWFVSKSGFCYEANGSVHAEVTLQMDGNEIEPEFQVDQPDLDIDIPWYCYLGAGLILAALGGVIAGLVGVVALAIVDAVAHVEPKLRDIEPEEQALGALGAYFDDLSTTPEGLTIYGTMSVALPAPASRSIQLNGSVVTTSAEVLSTGTYHNTFCFEGDFPYIEQAQKQVGTYDVVPTLLGRPLILEWQISAGNVGAWGQKITESAKVPLAGQSGTVSIPQVATHYPFPLPDGTIVTKDVNIDYLMSGDAIKLTNKPEDGNFDFWLHVKAKDPVGNVAETTKQGYFEGDAVIIGGGFQEQLQDCLNNLLKKLKALTSRANTEIMPPWVPVNYPVPDELIALIQSVVRSGVPEADELLAHTKLLHGSSFYRALSSPEATRVRGARERI
jgi:hypothetical protein